jgi:hypothetical protein
MVVSQEWDSKIMPFVVVGVLSNNPRDPKE